MSGVRRLDGNQGVEHGSLSRSSDCPPRTTPTQGVQRPFGLWRGGSGRGRAPPGPSAPRVATLYVSFTHRTAIPHGGFARQGPSDPADLIQEPP